MEQRVSRRRALAALGATSTTLASAGCLGLFSEEAGGDTDDGGSDADVTDGDGPTWPAIETGELLSDFEDLDRWEVQNGHIEAAPDEALTGTQAAVVESDDGTAGVSRFFPDGLDLEAWDTSIAVRPDSVSRIVVEFVAPSREERLNTVRTVPDEFDGWFRLDCGYEHKPEGEPDLSNVTRLNVIAVGPDGGPTRMLVDDLRRTEAVDNGKAILAFYGGHDSHYDIAAERLEERGWAGAVPVDPGRVGNQGRMDFAELRELRDRGWDVCSYPRSESDLTEQPEERQRTVIGSARNSLADSGFPDGSRHFFAPDWRRMTGTTHAIVRELHESGFLFGSCTTGAPPTGIHMTPVIWGPALHNGVRRHINLCDQYQQLTVIRVPRIVEGESGGNSMSLADFEHLLDHIEHRGLDVITPSDIVDGTMDGDDSGAQDEPESRPDGRILDAGASYSFEGTGTSDSAEFELEESILIGQFSHDGESEFLVDVTPIDGDLDDERLVTATGATSGESIMTVDGGRYRLTVEADGPWSIDLDQPAIHSDDLADLPVEASGTGSGFVGPLWTPDDPSLSVTHDGDGAFIVDGYGADGSWEQIVNKTGAFDNSRSYAASGVVWINVEADGNWTLDVSDS
ncbi:polysaccharide deacetylase [Halosolutus amylolyticus]|uniref:Polysaccharide deacetylase n=1 Tax=Halosolutus amylolyticus TaxID=2932267 RepID=A0ABD5PX62_9EURY|nr:polysaccharide deacetylase [Halosolutus amylolyticus]